MPDLDKVIQGLYCCVHNGDCYDCCPYHAVDTTGCKKQTMLADALALLKAQKPVKPTWRRGYAYCGKCGYKLHWIVDKNNYCPECGQAVKWE